MGEGGITPGDVGTYSAEYGFQKAFNLWDDGGSLQSTAKALGMVAYSPPPRNVTTDPGILKEGSTVLDGATRLHCPKTLTNGRYRYSHCIATSQSE